MKKIILVCSLFAFTATTVMAQNAPAAANAKTTTTPKFKKINFVSKASEIDATLSRQRPDLAQTSISDMFGMMVYFIGQNNNTLNDKTIDTDKAALQQTIDLQNKLYNDIKLLSPDMAKNKVQLAAKFKEFAATIPE